MMLLIQNQTWWFLEPNHYPKPVVIHNTCKMHRMIFHHNLVKILIQKNVLYVLPCDEVAIMIHGMDGDYQRMASCCTYTQAIVWNDITHLTQTFYVMARDEFQQPVSNNLQWIVKIKGYLNHSLSLSVNKVEGYLYSFSVFTLNSALQESSQVGATMVAFHYFEIDWWYLITSMLTMYSHAQVYCAFLVLVLKTWLITLINEHINNACVAHQALRKQWRKITYAVLE